MPGYYYLDCINKPRFFQVLERLALYTDQLANTVWPAFLMGHLLLLEQLAIQVSDAVSIALVASCPHSRGLGTGYT